MDAMDLMDGVDEVDAMDAMDLMDGVDEVDAMDVMDLMDEVDAMDVMDLMDGVDRGRIHREAGRAYRRAGIISVFQSAGEGLPDILMIASVLSASPGKKG